MKNIKESWLAILITAALSILGSLIIMSLTFKRDDSKIINEKLEKKAPYTYVDEQDKLIRNEIESNNEQHVLIIDMIKEMRTENQSNFSEIRKQLYRK